MLDDGVTFVPPVLVPEQHHEIIATDMANKIQPLAGLGKNDGGEAIDHLVPAAVPIVVVEWLEVIDIDIGEMKITDAAQQLVDLFINGHIARQLGQWIAVTGVADAYVGQVLEQRRGPPHPGVTTLPGNDEIQVHIPFIAVGDTPRHLVERCLAIHDQRGPIRVENDGFAPIEVVGIAGRKALHQLLAADDPHWHALFDHRQGIDARILAKQLVDLIRVGVRAQRRHLGHDCFDGLREARQGSGMTHFAGHVAEAGARH